MNDDPLTPGGAAAPRAADPAADERPNRDRIFSTIVRRAGTGLTRAALAAHTGLSPRTIDAALSALRAHGLIRDGEQTGGRSAVGRRPTAIRVNPGDNYVIGVEILGDAVGGVLANLAGEPVGERLTDTLPAAAGHVAPDAVVEKVRDLVDKLELQAPPGDDGPGRVLGVGVGIGGHVTPAGDVRYSVNMGWGRGLAHPPVPLRQRLRDATRKPVAVDNDANTLAEAQRWFGAGRDLDTFQLVLVSLDGIGAAYVAGGELVRGAAGRSNELGHLVVDPRGRRCRCRNHGCLEAHGTAAAIIAACGGAGDAPLAAALAALRVRADGDAAVAAAFTDAGHAMGRALASLINVNDPGHVIFIGDAVTEENGQRVLYDRRYHDAMWAAVSAHAFAERPAERSFIVVEDSQHWVGPRGAAALAIRDVINNPALVRPPSRPAVHRAS
ncbi:sugar kinase [Pilimelia anulata]|uniref:Sugar kinase n=1 Tax=Pilimelia anulata TaxID=53371 RepID=A0A8J3BB34_9ACTN|nr:ROK family transcriptional regulator [Pilimelia anulata]GGK07608.1 sugar kinase [Pilimelia anulata]